MELVQIFKSLKFSSCTPLFKEYHPAKKSVEKESKRKQTNKQTKKQNSHFLPKYSYSVTKPDIAVRNKRHYDNNGALYLGIDWFLTS